MPSYRALPGGAKLPLLLYRALFPAAFLLMLPGFLARMLRRGNYRHKFGQRFGLFSGQDRRALADGGWIWVHAVSVGEMMMALKLVRTLQETKPEARVLLSTTTSTGFTLAREQIARLPEPAELIYYPLDLGVVVRRVLDLIRPERLVLVDKELWPNLVSECYRRKIPVSIVNARLSPKSERGFMKWRRWVAPFFAMLDHVCVQEPEDVARWQALGVRPEALHCTGSIKFDFAVPERPREAEFRALLEPLGIHRDAATSILLGGSTFPGEEAALGRVFLALRPRWPGLTLIVVPRHVERTPAVEADLRALGLATVRRTALSPNGVSAETPRPDVVIVDTTGELRDWYAVATLCFIGKSLCSNGGQNPAEPILAGRPVLFGPSMENFAALVSQFLAVRGATQIRNESELISAAESLLADPALRQQQVERAAAVLRPHEGATRRTLDRILRSPASPAHRDQ